MASIFEFVAWTKIKIKICFETDEILNLQRLFFSVESFFVFSGSNFRLVARFQLVCQFQFLEFYVSKNNLSKSSTIQSRFRFALNSYFSRNKFVRQGLAIDLTEREAENFVITF